MARPLLQFITLLFGASTIIAAPVTLVQRQGTFSTLSAPDADVFKPFTFFASAAYCSPDKTKDWSCGTICDANPNFQPTASGGDGVDVQFWFVGFDPDLSVRVFCPIPGLAAELNTQSVVVAHQGTDPSKIVPLLTDADFFPEELDSGLFPGLSGDIKVHNGFRDSQAETSQDVLAAVQQTMQTHNTSKVMVVGHSLGGAIGLLNAVFLPLHIPGIDLEMIGYGMPRVGNQEFADYVDANVKLTRITNKKDVVPIIPGRFLGFHHPSSEIHIQDDGSFVSCPGQDNTDSRCSVGDAKNVLTAKVSDHHGPYAGISIDSNCPSLGQIDSVDEDQEVRTQF
ncbi:Lipase [Leucoagaricus sp. SymC.cos]|nr:Lipase [Leucoagaricus sp. SymC.cos]